MNNENILRLVGHNYTASFLNLYSAFQRVTEVEDNKENNTEKQIKTDNKAVRKKKIGGEKDSREKDSSERNNKAENNRKGKPIETE